MYRTCRSNVVYPTPASRVLDTLSPMAVSNIVASTPPCTLPTALAWNSRGSMHTSTNPSRASVTANPRVRDVGCCGMEPSIMPVGSRGPASHEVGGGGGARDRPRCRCASARVRSPRSPSDRIRCHEQGSEQSRRGRVAPWDHAPTTLIRTARSPVLPGGIRPCHRRRLLVCLRSANWCPSTACTPCSSRTTGSAPAASPRSSSCGRWSPSSPRCRPAPGRTRPRDGLSSPERSPAHRGVHDVARVADVLGLRCRFCVVGDQ